MTAQGEMQVWTSTCGEQDFPRSERNTIALALRSGESIGLCCGHRHKMSWSYYKHYQELSYCHCRSVLHQALCPSHPG